MKTIRVRLEISGRVQGVFFRTSAKREADRLGLSGFARNEPGGTVTIEVQGEEKAVKEFLSWGKEGPRLAKVGEVEVEEMKLEIGDTGFYIG